MSSERTPTRIDVLYRNGESGIMDAGGPYKIILKGKYINLELKMEDIQEMRFWGTEAKMLRIFDEADGG